MFDTLNAPSLLGDFCMTALNVPVVGKLLPDTREDIIDCESLSINFLTDKTLT